MTDEVLKCSVIDTLGRIENVVLVYSMEDFMLPEGYQIRLWQPGDRKYDEPEYTIADLSASQFNYMLAASGLDDVIIGVVAALKQQQHELYPAVYGHLAGHTFRLDKTLEIVAQLRPLVASLFPDADVSDENITQAWEAALNWTA